MLNALYILNTDAYHLIYDAVHEDIARLVNVYAPPQTSETIMTNLELLREVDIIFSGWGSVLFDQRVLDHARNLQAVFYGAGSIKSLVTEEFWERGILITSASSVVGLPVAEYTLAQILLCLKGVWYYARAVREAKTFVPRLDFPAAYGSIVGLISLSAIGRRVRELLRPFDLEVIVYDPLVTPEQAHALDVELYALDDLFRRADVVSLHSPWLPETEGMITGRHFRLMKPRSTFINTARGAIVRESEMIEVLRERQDVTAILDVTYPEPPERDSPLYTLPNIVLTPHVAGALGGECRRQGELMLSELRRYLDGKPLEYQVHREQLTTIA